MERLCGPKLPFWVANQTLHTDSPDLPECFQLSVLSWLPCVLLWLACPPYLFYLQRNKMGYIMMSVLNRVKTVIALVLWIVCWTDLFATFNELHQGYTHPPIYFVTPLVVGITMLLATFLIQFERLRGVQSSGILFIFWFLSVLCAIVPFRSKILQAKSEIPDKLRFITFYLYFSLVVSQLILCCFNEKPPLFSNVDTDPNPCPQSTAGFLSTMTFWWFTSMAIKGYKNPLEAKDLWSLNKRDSSEEVVPKLLREWDLEQKKAHSAQDRSTQALYSKPLPAGESNHVGEENSPEEVEVLLSKKKTPKKPSFLRSLIKAFGPYFLIGSAFKLLQDLITFVNPQLLSLLISFTKQKDAPTWWGYALAFLMFFTAFLQTLILHQHFQYCFVTGMRLRTSIIGAIYRKSLIITNAAKRTSTVGEIVNLMSVDAQRFMDLTTFLNMLWSAPLQIILALYFLWQNLGPSVLAGVAVMILLIPLNAAIAVRTRAYQVYITPSATLRAYRWGQGVEVVVMMIVKMINKALYRSAITLLLLSLSSSYHSPPPITLLLLLPSLSSSYHSPPPPSITLLLLSLSSSYHSPPSITLLLLSLSSSLCSSSSSHSPPPPPLTLHLLLLLLSLCSSFSSSHSAPPPVSVYCVDSVASHQASVSLKRIQDFLSHEELDPESVDRNNTATDSSVTVVNGKFTWAKQDPPALHNINLMVPQGSLLAVVGHVGCGKSSLVSALLGEMEKLEGHISIRGSVAYVPQQAWIQNATLRDNILFGKAYNEQTYRSCLEACALTPDLEVLPGGDLTEIGEKGINLSGGQRQRVSLARALYNEADVYLLDDPLSAVDSHVAKHIFDQVIGPQGALQGKTRILVTHGISFLPQVDNIMVIVEGRVSEMGSYQELLQQNGAFAEFLRNHSLEDIIEDEATVALSDEEEDFPDDVLSNHTDMVDSEPVVEVKRKFIRQISIISGDLENPRSKSVRRRLCSERKHAEPDPEKKLPKVEKLIQAETTETGRVKSKVFWEYIKAVGPLLTLFIGFLYGCQSAAAIGSNVWLSQWTNDAAQNVTEENVSMRVGVYAALGITQGILVMVSSFTLAMGNIGAARKLHYALLDNKFHTPQSFFDTTPIGRVINRFSKDIYVIDEALPSTVLMFLGTFFSSLSTMIVIVASTPIFAVVIAPLTFIYVFVQRFYVATSRQLKRLESVTRSPIYSHFSETVTGSSVIRAYGRHDAFVLMSDMKVDDNQKSYYPGIVANRWLGVRIEFIGNCIVLFAALFAVIGKDNLNPGLVGLSVSYALLVTMSLNWMVRMTSDLESNIVAVERVKEYSETKIEAPWEVEDKKPSPDWPSQGKVEFLDYSVRYREGLDLVLKNLTLSVVGGEKIGIVGRTGAGKSSMTLCLFRLLEAAGGEITIDGVKISEIGLHDLRSKLTIIPQEPVLFSGSLRMNLDPFDKYNDGEVWNALELSHLNKFVSNQPAKLQLECSEGGENLSVGQRQLVCLARALLRKTRILILDEATAAIDLETDDLIQSTIRTQFEDCTVFTIAHRLNTIMDYTRVLVLDKGQVAEFDTPSKLLSKRGIFYGMAKDAGLAQ
ncbi:ATP-binding cassette sub-family C member 3-like [Salvelinus fontinalis]|uniref:ATP-binding cassette sub-family C member 3-like n=1 Tax=Salvelinus fontinalis TaxID=8038 RepID=UPI002484DC07|nr:ATP-binding cassette sub-family C member 3-like [Salvelinus fontinalis]